MVFQFVALDNGRVDEVARKRIRSHVMRGKNTGRVLPPRHKGSFPGEVRITDDENITGLQISSFGRDIAPALIYYEAPMSTRFSDAFNYFTFPGMIDSRMKASLQQVVHVNTRAMFPPEICHPPDVFAKRIWFEYIQRDEAFFHSTLAMSEVLADLLRGREDTSPVALQHLSSTYVCIAKNLQKEKIPSDATLAAVVSMAIHEDLQGQPERCKVHMDALQHMVELRGGIGKMNVNETLLIKLCRADIEYSIHTGSRPFLRRDEFPYGMIRKLRHERSTIARKPVNVTAAFNLTSITGSIVDDLDSVACILNADPEARLDPYGFQELLVSLCYRLLDPEPVTGHVAMAEQDSAIKDGLLSLMTTILFQNGHPRRLSYALLAGRLRTSVERLDDSTPHHQTLSLWLGFAGGISVFNNATDKGWLLPHMKGCLQRTNIAEWRGILDLICLLPWIHSLHDKPAKRLWEEIIWT